MFQTILLLSLTTSCPATTGQKFEVRHGFAVETVAPRKINCQCGVGCTCPGTEGGECLCDTKSKWDVFGMTYRDGEELKSAYFVLKFDPHNSYPILQGGEYPYRNRESAQQEADWRNNPLVKSGEAWYVKMGYGEWIISKIPPNTADKYLVFDRPSAAGDEADRRNSRLGSGREDGMATWTTVRPVHAGMGTPPVGVYGAVPPGPVPCCSQATRMTYSPAPTVKIHRPQPITRIAKAQPVSVRTTTRPVERREVQTVSRPFVNLRPLYPQALTAIPAGVAGIPSGITQGPVRARGWITAAPNAAPRNTSCPPVQQAASVPNVSRSFVSGCVGRG